MSVKTIGIAILIILVFFGLPPIGENSTSECSALERLAVRQSHYESGPELRDFLQGLSQGSVAAEQIQTEYPHLPPGIGCTMKYWRILVDL